MGCCLSKNDPCSNSHTREIDPKITQNVGVTVKLDHTKKQVSGLKPDPNPREGCTAEEKVQEVKEVFTKKKKEVFVIQHSRKSNDKRQEGPESEGSGSGQSGWSREEEEIGRNLLAAAASGQAVRTSSCTKEEVDAILIQCGRLSRSSSGKGKVKSGSNGGHIRRYSGSKRSFDFDRESQMKGNSLNEEMIQVSYDDDDDRTTRCHSRGPNSRLTAPSRSRERSGSRERSLSNGRRVSRSPVRRSESPLMTQSNKGPPGKLVSVPATVTSLSVDKGSINNGNVKRVLVKRNVGSPRSQSPVRGASLGNGSAHPSLSRNGSRKAEHSPCRRIPLNEIDINSLPFHPLSNKRAVNKGKEIEEDVMVVNQPVNSGFQQNKYAETTNVKASCQGTHRRSGNRGAEGYEATKTNYCSVNEHRTLNAERLTEDKREHFDASEYDAMVTPVVVSGSETLKLPQTLVRSRSARRSRDLDINVEALLAPTPATNYNSLLLQDIQNFHQKKSSNANVTATATANAGSANVVCHNINANTPFTLPPCVSKACSGVEAVADLNSMTRADDRRKSPRETNLSFNNGNKRAVESKDPFVESEVKVGDDLMEPSLHKYVTVRVNAGDFDDEESSGSNSYVGGSQQNWVSSSSWEPTSADSTDCWTSKSYSREDLSPVGFQRQAVSEFAGVINEESERKFSKGASALVRTVAGKGPILSTSKLAAASM